MLTISGTKQIIDGCAMEQDDIVALRRRRSGDARAEREGVGLEIVWSREGMNEAKKDATQEMRLTEASCGDDDDGDKKEEESKEQQETRAERSSATAERTTSDECEQSKDAACTNGAQEEGACACSALMQPAASDRRLER